MSDSDGKKTLGVRGGGPRSGNVSKALATAVPKMSWSKPSVSALSCQNRVLKPAGWYRCRRCVWCWWHSKCRDGASIKSFTSCKSARSGRSGRTRSRRKNALKSDERRRAEQENKEREQRELEERAKAKAEAEERAKKKPKNKKHAKLPKRLREQSQRNHVPTTHALQNQRPQFHANANKRTTSVAPKPVAAKAKTVVQAS